MSYPEVLLLLHFRIKWQKWIYSELQIKHEVALLKFYILIQFHIFWHMRNHTWKSFPYWVTLITTQILWLNLHWNLMLFVYTYVLIPEITILGCSNHQTDITIELALKSDAISIYICTCFRNYHIKLVWSSNGCCHWIHTEIWCHFHIHMYLFQKLPY